MVSPLPRPLLSKIRPFPMRYYLDGGPFSAHNVMVIAFAVVVPCSFLDYLMDTKLFNLFNPINTGLINTHVNGRDANLHPDNIRTAVVPVYPLIRWRGM